MSIDVRAELDGEHEKKFDELQAFLSERTNGEKYGNANTMRMAIRLGHKKMQEIKKNRKEKVEEFKQYEKKIEKAVNNL